MSKLADDMTRLVSEMQTMREDRVNFVKGVREDTRELLEKIREEGKQRVEDTRELLIGFQKGNRERAEEIREYLAGVRSDMVAAHEAFFGKQPSLKG